MAVQRRRRGFVWPILLIGLGVILLLQNLGLIAPDSWLIIGRFWPVILILIGLELILNRGNPWLATALAAMVVVAAIVAAVIVSARGVPSWRAGEPVAEHLTQDMGQGDRAIVRLEFGAGDLAIGGLPAESTNLMEGDFNHSSGRTINRSFSCSGRECSLRLSLRNQGFPLFRSPANESWQVQLSPSIPIDLRVQSGASRLNLDLSALQLTALRLDVGASNGTIRLPRRIDASAVVKAGAADLSFEVPETTAARIRARGGLSSIQIDETRFPRDGDYFVSPDFASATDRIDLDLDAGVASIRIQ